MKKRQVLVVQLLICLIPVVHVFAQPRQEYIKVVVAPDHSDWIYTTGEEVDFRITVLKDGNPLEDISIHYEIKPELMESLKEGNVVLDGDFVTVDGGTMKEPGFLRCWATVTYERKEYKGGF